MLVRYSEFSKDLKLNENIAGAKKVLKDTYILNKALIDLDLGYKTDASGMFIMDKVDAPVDFKDLPEDTKAEAKKKVREIKVSEEEQRKIDRHPKFQEIREFLGDKLGWAQLFTYLHFKEKVEVNELKSIFKDLLEYHDLLGKLRRPISNYIDVNISNNTEQLIDDLEDIKRYRKLKKFIDEY
jgi:hypothetical protein